MVTRVRVLRRLEYKTSRMEFHQVSAFLGAFAFLGMQAKQKGKTGKEKERRKGGVGLGTVLGVCVGHMWRKRQLRYCGGGSNMKRRRRPR